MLQLHDIQHFGRQSSAFHLLCNYLCRCVAIRRRAPLFRPEPRARLAPLTNPTNRASHRSQRLTHSSPEGCEALLKRMELPGQQQQEASHLPGHGSTAQARVAQLGIEHIRVYGLVFTTNLFCSMMCDSVMHYLHESNGPSKLRLQKQLQNACCLSFRTQHNTCS